MFQRDWSISEVLSRASNHSKVQHGWIIIESWRVLKQEGFWHILQGGRVLAHEGFCHILWDKYCLGKILLWVCVWQLCFGEVETLNVHSLLQMLYETAAGKGNGKTTDMGKIAGTASFCCTSLSNIDLMKMYPGFIIQNWIAKTIHIHLYRTRFLEMLTTLFFEHLRPWVFIWLCLHRYLKHLFRFLFKRSLKSCMRTMFQCFSWWNLWQHTPAV